MRDCSGRSNKPEKSDNETKKESPIAELPTMPTVFSLNFVPKKPLIITPIRGNSGTNHTY